jgi:hypothetical protein
MMVENSRLYNAAVEFGAAIEESTGVAFRCIPKDTGGMEFDREGTWWLAVRDKHGNAAYISFRDDKIERIGAGRENKKSEVIWTTNNSSAS